MKTFKLLAAIVVALICANTLVANEPENKPVFSDKKMGVFGGICRFINEFRQESLQTKENAETPAKVPSFEQAENGVLPSGWKTFVMTSHAIPYKNR